MLFKCDRGFVGMMEFAVIVFFGVVEKTAAGVGKGSGGSRGRLIQKINDPKQEKQLTIVGVFLNISHG